MKIYPKIIPDSSFHKKGKHFSESWYTSGNVIENTSSGYYIDDSGNKCVLFIFNKNKIPKKYQDLAIGSFLEFSKKKHANRGVAGGIPQGQSTARHFTETGQNEGKYIASNISGYFDRPLREHRGILGTIRACRTTSFTLNNIDLWNRALPFIKYCSELYRSLGGKYYKAQLEEYNKIRPNVKIPDTVFTTVTSNYNWRTACHKDSGDYPGGLGNLVVMGNNYTGGYIGFPQFKVLIKILPGDYLLMDVHQYHCNTPIKTVGDGYRLSFVMYIRQDAQNCKKKVKVGNEVYFM